MGWNENVKLGYIEDIEAIHLMDSDELEHVLSITQDDLEFVWTHPKVNPTESLESLKKQIDFNLNTLIHSIKKSLLYFYPKREKELSEVVDANEAMWSLRIMDQSHTRSYPFYEGIQALVKIYLQIGLHYPCEDSEALEMAKSDFNEMGNSIKNYARIAIQYYYARVMKEIGQRVEKARPYIEEGKKRKKQLAAPKQKKNKALLKHCNELMSKKLSKSAADLKLRFPKKEKAIIIDGTEIYRELTENGEEKIFCISHTGKPTTVGDRAFADYYSDTKKSLNVNS